VSEATIHLIIEAVIAVILIVAMTWVVLSPVSDEVTKGALVILSGATGYIFGRRTS